MAASGTNDATFSPRRNIDRAEQVFAKHGEFIRSVIRFHVKNGVESEDLFQEFFLFIVANPIPQNVQNIKGLLYCMISGRVKDAFRKTMRDRRRLKRYGEHYRYIPDNRPEHDVIDTEETEKMFDLIRKHLPQSEAFAVTLKYGCNYDIQEVAQKMGLKKRSVSRYVSAGLSKLRQIIGTEKGGYYDSFR